MAELGQIVHYVTRDIGPKECRAALITRVWPDGRASLRLFALVKELDWDPFHRPRADWAGPDTPAGTWHEGGHGDG